MVYRVLNASRGNARRDPRRAPAYLYGDLRVPGILKVCYERDWITSIELLAASVVSDTPVVTSQSKRLGELRWNLLAACSFFGSVTGIPYILNSTRIISQRR